MIIKRMRIKIKIQNNFIFYWRVKLKRKIFYWKVKLKRKSIQQKVPKNNQKRMRSKLKKNDKLGWNDEIKKDWN